MLTILQKISPVLLLLAVATLLVAVFLNHTPETIFFADDGAFALSLGNIILDGDLIFSGLPSHLGGRHIGPFYLYLVAGISFLARQDPYLTIFLFSLFKVLTTGILISYLFSFFVPRKYFSLGLTFVFAAITAGDSVVNFRILWVNNLISIFVLLQLIVLFHLFQFGKRVLPAFILSSSFLIQIHLMTAPLILVTWVAGLASLRKSTTEQAKSFFTDPIVRLISTVLSLLLWLLPLIYEVFYESNFRKLFIKHFQSENSGVGILAAGKLFYKFVCHNLFGQTYYQSLQAGSPFYWKAIFLLIICLAGFFFLRLLLRLDRAEKWLGITIVLTLLISILSVSRLQAPVHHYYYNCYLFLPPFLLGIVIVSLFDLSERGGLIKALGYSVIGLIFGLYLVLINRNLEYYSGKLFEPTATLEHAREVAEIIENDRGWEKHIEVLVHERRRHRKNAIYHLLSGQNFRRMQYSGYFKELRTKPEFAKTPAKILYLLTCPKPGPKKKAKTMLNLSKNWKFQYEISLTCSTCGNCELNRFATNLVLDRKLHH